MPTQFFPPRPQANPTIYAYLDTNPQYKGLLKVGFTNSDAAKRVAQQSLDFKMRPEQIAAVDKTIDYLRKCKRIRTPRRTFCGMPKCVLAKPLPLIN